MKCKKLINKLLALPLILGLMLQLTSCGTLMYPERRGQTSGNLDPAVAILDGIGVFFFVVPGLIAFAVDFATGAIYLPAGTSQVYPVPSDESPMTVIHEDSDDLSIERVQKIVSSHTGKQINLKQNNVQIYEFGSDQNIRTEISKTINTDL